MNVFRHWFLWSAIETAPGVYDWEPYDRQLDLAAQHGLKTIIAEMITAAPEWAYHRYAHARYEMRDGRRLQASMGGSCATGGFPGLCLDNDDYRALAERFLSALATRYKGHPALGGYDIWNECNYSPDTCYCPATVARFRTWLQAKYGHLHALAEVWRRYSFAEWEDVTPPRGGGAYPDMLDWLQFRIENAYGWMRWRMDTIRSIDPDCAVVAHGVAGALTNMAAAGMDDWRAAAEVEAYGYTWVSSRQGDEPWKQFHAVDLVRAASQGKPFWHAEATGGPLWMQPQVIGKPRDEGRISSAEDVRYWGLVTLMTGARGILYVRWRGLLDGPLFAAFGLYGLDGARTSRSEMAAGLGRWATDPAQQELWRSRPVKGDVGIVYVPETQIFTYAQQGNTTFYAQSLRGAYRAFFRHNIQADWVHIDDIESYDLLYLPFPVMLSPHTAERLRRWVAAGGTLVSEGCPAYFGERGRVGTVQPNYGMGELLGVRESYVEFTPDILGDLSFRVGGLPVWGGIFLQAYEPTTGRAVGWYQDGQVAVVDNVYGKGRTRLIGTMVGAGYAAHGMEGGHEPDPPAPFFSSLLSWAHREQHITCSEPHVQARLQDGPGGTYLWVANPTQQTRPVRLQLSHAYGPYGRGQTLWGAQARVEGRIVTLLAPARDVTIIALAP